MTVVTQELHLHIDNGGSGYPGPDRDTRSPAVDRPARPAWEPARRGPLFLGPEILVDHEVGHTEREQVSVGELDVGRLGTCMILILIQQDGGDVGAGRRVAQVEGGLVNEDDARSRGCH